MSKNFSKILSLVAGLIGLIAFYYFVRIVMTGDDTLETDLEAQASIISPFITFAKWILIATGLIAVVFSMINLVKHPKVLKRSLIGVAVMADNDGMHKWQKELVECWKMVKQDLCRNG